MNVPNLDTWMLIAATAAVAAAIFPQGKPLALAGVSPPSSLVAGTSTQWSGFGHTASIVTPGWYSTCPTSSMFWKSPPHFPPASLAIAPTMA